jgi:hypothetical protein
VIDHLILGVDDIEASKAFYERSLAPLGMEVVLGMPGGAGFGRDGKPVFWVADREPSGPVHVAFACPDRATVDAFHAAAGAATTAPRGCARTTTRPTTAHSSTTRTATTSRRSATARSRAAAVPGSRAGRQAGDVVATPRSRSSPSWSPYTSPCTVTG